MREFLEEEVAGASAPGFSAEAIRARMAAQETARHLAAEAIAAERLRREELARLAFDHAPLPGDALARCMAAVERAVLEGVREAVICRFPSGWMSDSGRSLTSGNGDWRGRIPGLAARWYHFHLQSLAPRGFVLEARILDWPGGMPGEAGLVLRW